MKQMTRMMLSLLPLFSLAQQKTNVAFSSAGNWNDLQAEAKKLNKTIFVDVYATWCVPCKKMDEESFTDRAVTDFMNANFVAIKVQMDQTKSDNEFVKNWQKDAEKWEKYLTAYPCFLFFTPDGQFAGLELGYHKPQDFLSLLKRIVDPEQSYLARIRRFQEGKLNNKPQLLALAYQAKNNKDTIATAISRIYKQQYLDPLPMDSLLNAEVTKFAENFYMVFNAKDKLIKYMNKYPDRIDSLSGWDGNAKKISDYTISQEYIKQRILPAGIPIKKTPEWNKMRKLIAKDFDRKTADRLILNAKILWAYKHNNTEEAINYEFQKIDRYGMDTTASGRGFFNNMVYEVVFSKVGDVALLKKAASLMKYVNELERQQNAAYLDTYAGLLYKVGNKSLAIQIENIALERAQAENNQEFIRLFSNTIERMNKGELIWKN